MASAMLCAPAAISASADSDCKIKDLLSKLTQYTETKDENQKCGILEILGAKFSLPELDGALKESLPSDIIDFIEKDESDKQETPDTSVPEDDISEKAEQVIELVNSYRAQYGLSAVQYDKAASCAAQKRALEIQSVFSHTRPDGSRCFTALDECGASYHGAGENIAMGQSTADEVMNDWMNSQGHRENILNGNFTKIGVGVSVGADGRIYWTQMFTY